MKIVLAQVDPKVGDLEGNAALVRDWMSRARGAKADLVVFPELCLTGYPPRDLLDYPCIVDKNLEILRSLAAETSEMAVLVGFVDRNPSPWGPPFANAAALLRGGKVEAVYRKQCLPTYDVFDERRFFEPGTEPLFFTVAGKKLAVQICEDAWNRPGYLDRLYKEQPLDALKGKSLDGIINLSASPFHLGKPEVRRRLFAEIARELGCAVFFCNQVGGNDDLLFDGASLAVNAAGQTLAQGPLFQESLVEISWGAASTQSPWPTQESEWVRGALVMGIRGYAKKTGVSKAVIGLSGGIDSSVVAVLAAEAFGKENVLGVALPTRFTSQASLEDAEKLAKQLSIGYHVCDIEPIRAQYAELWRKWFGGDPKSLTQENVQPRIRMTVLMALANERGAFLLNTSNKSEIATGYSTLYGDSAGALAVLGDLVKGQIYDLARWMNREKEVIPARVLNRPPTAELREGQTDQETLPPYDVLDRIVRESVERGQGDTQLIQSGIDAQAVATFKRLFGPTEYKRYQLPPVLRVSAHAFGTGRRMPLAAYRPC